MKTFISVVIPAHNEEKHITNCLNSMLEQDYPRDRFEILVVDNNSTDRTASIIRTFSQVKYLEKKNGPVGAVRNYGASNSKGDILAFIDSDCIAPRNWLSIGEELVQLDDKAVVGGRYDLPLNATWIESNWLLGENTSSLENKDLLGGTIVIPKAAFLEVGGFDEHITSGEDSKLAQELRKAGYRVKIEKNLNVIHLGNAKTIGSFIERQAWHSENYIKNLSESLKDITFLIVVSMLACLIALPFSAWYGEPGVIIANVASLLLLPSLFSIKRLIRSDKPFSKLNRIHKIYLIDVLYIVGRIKGIIRGLRSVYA